MPSRLAGIASLLAFGLLTLVACQPAIAPSPAREETVLPANDTPTFALSAVPSPTSANQVEMLPSLSKLYMQTKNAGWSIDLQAAKMYYTTDGGTGWHDVTPPSIDPGSNLVADFLDTEHAWAATVPLTTSGSGPTPTKITVYSTDDAGQTWQFGEPVDISGGGPSQLDFVDPLHGWMVADLGVAAGSQAIEIFRTTDGGMNWESISFTSGYEDQSSPGSLPFACSKSGLAFRDVSNGWASGSCPGGFLFFFETQDGGQTWTHKDLPKPAGYPEGLFSSCMCDVFAPEFITSQDGFLTVKIYEENQEAFLYVTHDGGASWQPFKLPTNQIIDRPVFIDSVEGWFSDGNQLYRTQDGGQTWTIISSLPPPNQAASLDFATTQDGWYTDGDHLYFTRDSGRTWSILR